MDATLTKEYEAFEERHWWSVGRRAILYEMLGKHVAGASAGRGRWLDVGCGAGVIIDAYRGFAERIGAELDSGTVERARAKGRDVRQTAASWDFSEFGQFDCVSLFDVLEHVEHEQPALDAVHAALKDDGVLLVTVPALMSLWSDHDVVAHHFRRYTARDLLARFPADKWEILKVSYFSTILFPLVWMVRQIKGMLNSLRPARDPRHDLKFGIPLVDRALGGIFRLEAPLLRHGDLPIGSSLLLIARKKRVGELSAIGAPDPARPVARWITLALGAVVFTLANIRYSLSRGRLARTPTYDDISYFIDAIRRLRVVYGQAVVGWIHDYIRTPPHSPYSDYLALAAYVLFGVKDWAPYALNVFLVLALLYSADYLMRGARVWQRMLVGIFVLSIPLACNMVTEFRPDLAWALAAAMAVILPLRRSLVDSSWKRQMAAGAWCAAALLAKTSVFPLTLMTVGAAWCLGVVCDRVEKGPQITFRRVVGTWLICAAPIVLFAMPHYIIDFQGVRNYIASSLSGNEREIWSRKGDLIYQLRFFIDGEGGGFMLGRDLAILAAVLAIGFIALARRVAADRKAFGQLLRALSLAFIAFVAYIVPAVNPVKNDFFAAEFHLLLLLGAVLVLHMLLVPKDPKHQTGFGTFLLVGITALALAIWHFPPPWDATGVETANTNRVVHSVEQVVFDNAPAGSNLFVTGAGRVNASTLYYLLNQDGKQIEATDLHRLTDLNLYKQQIAAADVVVAAEPGVDEFENWLPSYKILDQTLQLIRDWPDFHEVGSVPSQSGKRFFVFARRPAFGGWNSTTNLSQAEGPFPQQGLPIIRWGLYPGVGLQVSNKSAGVYRLIVDGSAPVANQQMSITVDGREVGRHTLTAPGVFEQVEFPLDLTTGEHEIGIAFSAFKGPNANDTRQLGVLFKRLQILHAAVFPAGKQ